MKSSKYKYLLLKTNTHGMFLTINYKRYLNDTFYTYIYDNLLSKQLLTKTFCVFHHLKNNTKDQLLLSLFMFSTRPRERN